jgi:hypothetical protein
MKNTIKKSGLAVLIALVIMGVGIVAHAEDTFEGTVQGFTCLIQGKMCPLDRKDPVAAAEKLFVVAAMDKSYVIVSNMDRTILAKYMLAKVKLTGKKHSKYNAFKADSFEVYQNGKWRTVWTLEMQKEAFEELSY